MKMKRPQRRAPGWWLTLLLTWEDLFLRKEGWLLLVVIVTEWLLEAGRLSMALESVRFV